MMIFMGLVLLVVYAVGAINGGWFNGTLQRGRGATVYSETEEFKSMSVEEQYKYSAKLLIKLVGVLLFGITVSVLITFFLIGALGVDVLVFPTVILLSLMVIKAIRLISSKKYREKISNRNKEDRKGRERFSCIVYILYILYILILLIF